MIDDPIVNEAIEYLGHAHLSFSDQSKEAGFWDGNRNTRRAALANLAEAFRKNNVPLCVESVFS